MPREPIEKLEFSLSTDGVLIIYFYTVLTYSLTERSAGGMLCPRRGCPRDLIFYLTCSVFRIVSNYKNFDKKIYDFFLNNRPHPRNFRLTLHFMIFVGGAGF